MVNERFISHYDVDNKDLQLILNLMRHPNKDEAQRFLCMINDVMNYYMCRTDDEVRYPLLYVPMSQPWAQEVCVEFVTLKLSLFYNSLSKQRLYNDIVIRGSVRLPEKCSKLQQEYLRGAFRYKKSVYNAIKDQTIPAKTQKKNLIICKSFDNATCGNAFLKEFCGDETTICSESYSVSRADISVEQLDTPIKKRENATPQIENIFVFLSRGTNGRFTDAYSFQRPRIERLNKLGAGIKNVFYFYFSTKPYKLHRQLIWKTKNAVDILHQDIKEMKDFISFSYEESDYLFFRKRWQRNYVIEPNAEFDEFRLLAHDALNICDYSVQVRNNLAVCYNALAQEIFCTDYDSEIEGIDSQYFDIYLKSIIKDWDDKIFPAIASFLKGRNRVSVIVDIFMPDSYKSRLRDMFASYGINATIDSLKSLKYRLYGDEYWPHNDSERIIMLSYQGHYTGKAYNRYPNSFDPICLGRGQKLLNIVNTSVFDPYYSVHLYEYQKILKNILTSDYRKSCLKCSISTPVRPKHKIEDGGDRTIFRVGSRANFSEQKYKAITTMGDSIKLGEADLVICKESNDHGVEQIMTISALHDLMQECDQCYLMYPLAKLQIKLEEIIEDSGIKIKEGELYIRKDSRYGLTAEEVISDDELWEILLRRCVEKKGADVVYRELMDQIPYSEQIKRMSFDRWWTHDNNMILPRSRKMQDALLNYLAIEPPYDKIIRRKKAQKSTNTELKNSMLKTFLCDNLHANNYTKAYNKLSDSIVDMLSLDNAQDLKALVEMLREAIEFYEIKSLDKYGRK